MARVARLGFIPPQLPSLTDQPPERADWIHEVKHDGYRTMLLVERGAAFAHTRNGHNWSDHTPALLQRHASLRAGRQSSMARSLCRTHAVCLRGLTGSASLPALTLNFLRLRPVRPPPGRTQGETLGIGQARPGKSNSVQRRVHWRCCRILSRLCRT